MIVLSNGQLLFTSPAFLRGRSRAARLAFFILRKACRSDEGASRATNIAMKPLAKILLTLAFTAMSASLANAAEPRPWLCRDKPVFSSQQPISYDLTAPFGWRLFLMQFTPGAGHDGFDIAKTVDGSSSGHLPSGRYFAVALHNAGGHWICPAYVREQHPGAGVISSLCFAEHEDGCTARMNVRSDLGSAAQ